MLVESGNKAWGARGRAVILRPSMIPSHEAEARLGALYDRQHMPRLLAILAGVLLFVLGLYGGTRGVRLALAKLPGISMEEPGPPRIKALHWEHHRDRYGVAFVGSSRVFRQLDPLLFQEVCAKRGLELEAYNWGLPGMRTYESMLRVEAILRSKPARLKWLVIELLPPSPQSDEANRRSLREIQWHTPYLSALAMRRSLSDPGSLAHKRAQLGLHAYQGAANFLNLGSLGNAWEQWIDPQPLPQDASDSGFFPLELDRSPQVRERRLEFQTELGIDPDLLLGRVREFKAAPKSLPPDELLEEQMQRLQRQLARAGVQPIFVIVPPLEEWLPQMRGAFEAGLLPNLFDYGDPAEYRSFYANDELRFDMNHLNDKGLERLTRRFASDFVKHVTARPEGE